MITFVSVIAGFGKKVHFEGTIADQAEALEIHNLAKSEERGIYWMKMKVIVVDSYWCFDMNPLVKEKKIHSFLNMKHNPCRVVDRVQSVKEGFKLIDMITILNLD